MTPLKALVGLVALLFDAFFPSKTRGWPDGEQPLIDESQLFDDRPFLSDSYLRYSDNDMQLQTAYEPPSPAELGVMEAKFEALGLFDHPKLGGWYREMFGRSKSSAESAAPEAGVDVAEKVPTPGRAHTPGVGHLTSAPRDCSCDEHTDAYLYDPGHHPACITQLPKVTASLLISASIGLRDYADSDACEAPVYWRSIASQLDPNERKS